MEIYCDDNECIKYKAMNGYDSFEGVINSKIISKSITKQLLSNILKWLTLFIW